MRFLRENWLWIALPFLAVLALVATALWVGGGDNQDNPFVYSIFGG